ncbi:hypothetical protein [Enterococcus sp. UD-01]|jgi:hypothetical protein|uniref:hypothetical protein n=1 Tax=Enterococcus sp. UD-01 TaxID=3373911 RepID=UPI003836F26E
MMLKKHKIEYTNYGEDVSKIKVITLCGSAKFMKEFKEVEANLSLKGIAVLSPIFFEQSKTSKITKEVAQLLGNMHFRKIELADEIFVMDVGGYIGESTRKEIAFAKSNNKNIRYYSAFISDSTCI